MQEEGICLIQKIGSTLPIPWLRLCSPNVLVIEAYGAQQRDFHHANSKLDSV